MKLLMTFVSIYSLLICPPLHSGNIIIGLIPTSYHHLHIMGLSDNPTCRKGGAEEESLAHILCEYDALASLRHIHLGSFFLDPEDIRLLGAGAIWNFVKGTGLL